MEDTFTFIPPPECPVFRPTKDEFKDPLEYIEQIKPIAVKSGICKIIPPDGWKPPFSVNVKTFQFTPRVQKLYELEAQSRVKLNFMTKLSQFVRLQGNDKLKIPNINGHHVDLYKLNKLVHDFGGYDHVTANKLWPKIGSHLGYKMSNQIHTLRTHYEKIILPYNVMVANTSGGDAVNCDPHIESKPKPVLHPSTTKKRRSIDIVTVDPSSFESSNEVKRLQFVGAGPRMFNGPKYEENLEGDLISNPLKRKDFSEFFCKICGSGDQEDRLLICDNDKCQDSYHCDCLVPPIANVPKQSWKCPNCVIEVLNKKPSEYGFPSSSTTYSLHDFGRSADKFKANYFGKELHEVVSCSDVEKEFWRILQSFNDDIVVEYGADIHSSHQGSGFPTTETIANGMCTLNNGETDMDLATKYSTEPWNLNNLPVNKRSILSYIKGNIDGMKIPWCYVGMVFSSFCWHIEDHWSFSINYMHWGEPKTWYGVSGDDADLFETAMKKQAPELFNHHEDLLHHITTTMNPNILQREGVPVCRADQHAGEFMVTFPRAYHTGFNQGFNFAEAVNFCPATWLPMGRACIRQYAKLRRHCVFSHEELLCTMAEAAILELDEVVGDDNLMKSKYPLVTQLGLSRAKVCLDTSTRRVLHTEMEIMVAEEEEARTRVQALGITKTRKQLFDSMDDDERACQICQTTCFLSALGCLCVVNSTAHDHDGEDEVMTKKVPRITCLRHLDENVCDRCKVEDCTLLYRFTIEEIKALCSGIEAPLLDFSLWEANVKRSLTKPGDRNHERVTIDELRQLLNEGAECGFDRCDDYVAGRAIVERGESMASVCKYWLTAIEASEDCVRAVKSSDDVRLPKSVLVDCEDGGAEVKLVSIKDMTEDNLRCLARTVAQYPVVLPCTQFCVVVDRLLNWSQHCHALMDSYQLQVNVDPSNLLTKVVSLFDEARKMFPGWPFFNCERASLLLMGKTVQWLVRVKEITQAYDTRKPGSEGSHCVDDLVLPRTLVKEAVVEDLMSQGKRLKETVESSRANLGDVYMDAVMGSLEARLGVLGDMIAQVAALRHDAGAITRPVLSVSGRVLDTLARMTRLCAGVGVRVQALDDVRVRFYEWCVASVLGIGTSPCMVALDQATLLLSLGTSLMAEGVLDPGDVTRTQRHKEACTRAGVATKAVEELRRLYGCSGAEDTDLLSLILPRVYGEAPCEGTVARHCSEYTEAWALAQWHPSTPGGPVVGLMALYQSMMVQELVSVDGLLKAPVLGVPGTLCCVCSARAVGGHEWAADYCPSCAPRSRLRPTIADLAHVNNVMKHTNVVSGPGIALQALSKRTVTWLESLVTVLRVHARPLLSHYARVSSQPRHPVPATIKAIFSALPDHHKTTTTISKDLVTNLDYLARVGHCLEVNLDSYLSLIHALLRSVTQDTSPRSSTTTTDTTIILDD